MRSNKIIILGDLHLGYGNFKDSVFNNQLVFFRQQLIPYMLENNITTIIQTGDFFDNRRLVDINFLDRLYSELLDIFKENNINIITYLGNHDIYYKDTRKVNLIKHIQKNYSNITLIQDNTTLEINNKKVAFIPWCVNEEEIKNISSFIKNVDIVFGHFEIRDFQLTKGIYDEKSELSDKDFKNKQVYSGHYHIRDNKKNLTYVGTPYQLNWNDFGNECGFTVLDENFGSSFIMNNVSKRYCIIEFYNNYVNINFGFNSFNEINKKEFSELSKEYFKNAVVKFYVKESKDNSYEDFIFYLKENNIDYTFINNVDLLNIINPGNVVINNTTNTNTFILDFIKDNSPDLLEMATEIISEVVSSIE